MNPKYLLFLILSVCVLAPVQGQPSFELVRTLTGHTDKIYDVAISPDDRYILTASFDNTAKLWELQTGRLLQTFRGHDADVNAVAFYPFGEFILTGSDDETARLWNIETGEEVLQVDHKDDILAIAFSPDGAIFATGGDNKAIHLWDANSGELRGALKGHKDYVRELRFSPDGEQLLSVASDFTARLWEVSEFRELERFEGHGNTLAAVDLDVEQGIYLTGDFGNRVVLWNLETGKEIRRFEGHTDDVRAVAFSPSFKYCLSAGEDKTVKIWDLETAEEVHTLPLHTDYVYDAIFSHDGRYIITGSADKTVQIWKVSLDFQSPQIAVKRYVEANINQWQQKGEFEKRIDWQNRLTQSAYEKEITRHEYEIVSELQQKYLAKFPLTLGIDGLYDAERERFRIETESYGAYWLSVGIEDAPRFKESFEEARFTNIQFGISGREIVLYSFTLEVPSVGSFPYKNDAMDRLVSGFEYEFEEVESREDIGLFVRNEEGQEEEGQHEEGQGEVDTEFAEQTPPLPDFPEEERQGVDPIAVFPDIEENIPLIGEKNPKAFALVIGNEDYQSYQRGLAKEVNVDFAISDAQVFRQYAINTLGVPERQVLFLENATSAQMSQEIERFRLLMEHNQGVGYIYYAGHGLPDLNSKQPYLIPVDVSSANLRSAIALDKVYQQLGKIDCERITVFLDACFSGGARNQGLLAARGVRVKAKPSTLSGKLMVFSASTGEQSALPYRSKQHGMFTYFLLKKLQETKANLDYKTLAEYLMYEVPNTSLIENSRAQEPQIQISPALKENWETMRLRD